MKNKNLFMIMILIIIIFNSTVYSALNSEMFINGDARIRVDKDIRITDVKVLEQVNGSYETYNSDYSKNTTSMQVSLPSNESVMVYEVTITNKSGNDYEVINIVEESYSNSNIKYELIDIENEEVIDGGTTYTFKIKFTTTENNLDNKTTLVLKYNFKEYNKTEWVFNYIKREQKFKVPYNGVYKLETWGAQGGSVSNYYGGYGAYATGTIQLKKRENIFVVVGGKGVGATTKGQALSGGYNGGGDVLGDSIVNHITASGGGATHIARKAGLLSTFENDRESILIVSGGGGGARDQSNHEETARWGHGGSGGGAVAGGVQSSYTGFTLSTYNELSGTQISGYAFGQGETATSQGAGGGGYYGGLAGELVDGRPYYGTGGGGSGYIGNISLTNKIMYCYNCNNSDDETSKTISTMNVSDEPLSNYTKKGHGYAKITLISKK